MQSREPLRTISPPSTGKILYAAAGLLAGCLIGFFFANSVNRRELDELRAAAARGASPNANARSGGAPASDGAARQELSEEELRAVIQRADANQGDTDFQRKVGRALYLYAANFDKPELLAESARLLRRAHEAEPDDYDTLVALGNVLFDQGQAGSPEGFAAAREYYEKALTMRPDDVNVRTDLGLAYFFARPPDPQRAIREYRKSLALNPRHEPTLQHLANALIATGALDEAERRLGELEKINPSNARLNDLRAQLAQARNAAKEKE